MLMPQIVTRLRKNDTTLYALLTQTSRPITITMEDCKIGEKTSNPTAVKSFMESAKKQRDDEDDDDDLDDLEGLLTGFTIEDEEDIIDDE